MGQAHAQALPSAAKSAWNKQAWGYTFAVRQRVSAGLLMYRHRDGRLEVFLAHPGGPFFARRDEGCWSIPKGEIERGEDMLATAIREFKEEVGIAIDPHSRFIPLGSIRQKGGKIVHAWGVEHDCEPPPPCASNTFTIEWPPHSGRLRQFPEVDRAGFFAVAEARKKLKDTQIPLLDRLEAALRETTPAETAQGQEG